VSDQIPVILGRNPTTCAIVYRLHMGIRTLQGITVPDLQFPLAQDSNYGEQIHLPSLEPDCQELF